MAATRILIADDHPLFREALKQALAGGLPRTVIGQAGSLDQVRQHLGEDDNCDLVLLDLKNPAQCHFNIFVGPWSEFGDCDKAKDFLTKSGLSFKSNNGSAGTKALLEVNGAKVEGFSPFAWSKALVESGYPLLKLSNSVVELDKPGAEKLAALQAENKTAEALKLLSGARIAKDAAAAKIAAIANIDGVEAATDGTAKVSVSEVAAGSADKAKINWPMAILILSIMMLYVTMVYDPIAAFLVELFPTKIRYTSMSLPYHIGNGWFGGMLPLLATAIVAYTGNVYAGLWYPILVAIGTAIIGFFFLKETKDVDIAQN